MKGGLGGCSRLLGWSRIDGGEVEGFRFCIVFRLLLVFFETERRVVVWGFL